MRLRVILAVWVDHQLMRRNQHLPGTILCGGCGLRSSPVIEPL